MTVPHSRKEEQLGAFRGAYIASSLTHCVTGSSRMSIVSLTSSIRILASRVNSGQPAAGPSKGLSEVLRLTIGTAGGMCGNSV